MQTIIIGFSQRTAFNLLSLLIRACTKSQVSHVFVKLPDSDPTQTVVFQASGLEVNFENYDLFLQAETVIQEYAFQVSDEQYQAFKKFRLTQVGKPYSLSELFGFIYVLGMRQLGKQVSNPFSAGSNAYICVDIGADSVGYNESGSLTPEDFRRWISQQPQATLLPL